jgi:hypothetical protein
MISTSAASTIPLGGERAALRKPRAARATSTHPGPCYALALLIVKVDACPHFAVGFCLF